MLNQLVLVDVTVNLQRVCMSCRRFFCSKIVCVRCSDKVVSRLERNHYGVSIEVADDIPDGTVGLFPGNEYLPLSGLDWSAVSGLAIGNERTGLRNWTHPRATIPTRDGKALTVEAATAIALYEASKC